MSFSPAFVRRSIRTRLVAGAGRIEESQGIAEDLVGMAARLQQQVAQFTV